MLLSYFHRVEVDRAEAVHTPGERADGAAPLLIPDVHLLATRSKQTLLPVMVQACKHCLHGDKICFAESEWVSHFREFEVIILPVEHHTEMGLYHTNINWFNKIQSNKMNIKQGAKFLLNYPSTIKQMLLNPLKKIQRFGNFSRWGCRRNQFAQWILI